MRSKSHEKPIHILYFILSYFLRNKQNTIFVLEKHPKILNLRKSIHHEFDDFLQFFKFLLPYKGLMGTCGQPGYVFRDFCLKQAIDFIIFWHRKSVRPLSRSHVTLHCICYICLIKKTNFSLRLKVTYRCCDKF